MNNITESVLEGTLGELGFSQEDTLTLLGPLREDTLGDLQRYIEDKQEWLTKGYLETSEGVETFDVTGVHTIKYLRLALESHRAHQEHIANLDRDLDDGDREALRAQKEALEKSHRELQRIPWEGISHPLVLILMRLFKVPLKDMHKWSGLSNNKMREQYNIGVRLLHQEAHEYAARALCKAGLSPSEIIEIVPMTLSLKRLERTLCRPRYYNSAERLIFKKYLNNDLDLNPLPLRVVKTKDKTTDELELIDKASAKQWDEAIGDPEEIPKDTNVSPEVSPEEIPKDTNVSPEVSPEEIPKDTQVETPEGTPYEDNGDLKEDYFDLCDLCSHLLQKHFTISSPRATKNAVKWCKAGGFEVNGIPKGTLRAVYTYTHHLINEGVIRVPRWASFESHDCLLLPKDNL